MIDIRRNVGRLGEELACRYLQERGHKVIQKNWRAAHREIDIISITEGSTLHIVEVKSRTAPLTADPSINVNLQKQKNLISAAKVFLNSEIRKDLPQDLEVVFDVICIVFYDERVDIEYYPQAYIPIYV